MRRKKFLYTFSKLHVPPKQTLCKIMSLRLSMFRRDSKLFKKTTNTEKSEIDKK